MCPGCLARGGMGRPIIKPSLAASPRSPCQPAVVPGIGALSVSGRGRPSIARAGTEPETAGMSSLAIRPRQHAAALPWNSVDSGNSADSDINRRRISCRRAARGTRKALREMCRWPLPARQRADSEPSRSAVIMARTSPWHRVGAAPRKGIAPVPSNSFIEVCRASSPWLCWRQPYCAGCRAKSSYHLQSKK